MKKVYKPRKNGKSRKSEGVARQVIEGFNETLNKSKKLSNNFDECIKGHNGHQFIYSTKCIISKLKQDSKQQIIEGKLDKYDQGTIDDSALIYAIEDFEFNFESIKGKQEPIYLDDLDHES
jgi:hypothetical protein